MQKYILPGLVLAAVTALSFSALAMPERQQIRERFDEKMVQPCQGKKAGDEVTITTRRGDKIQAICTLTAVPKPQ